MTEDQLDVLSDYLSPGIKAPLQAHLAKQGRKHVSKGFGAVGEVKPWRSDLVVAAAGAEVGRSVKAQGFGLAYGADPASLAVEAPSPVALIQGSGEALSMTSNQISDLVGSRHEDVRRSIDRLVDRGVIEAPPMAGLKTLSGQTSKSYIFQGEQGKRDSIIVVAQLSPEFTAKLVDRWQELEAQVAKPAPANLNDPAALRGLLLGYTEQVLQLEHQVGVQAIKIEEDKPKVQFHDAVAVSPDNKTMKEVADLLNVGRTTLFKSLRKHGVLITGGKNHNLPYQVHKDAGRFVVALEPYKHPHTGELMMGTALTVTSKGLIWLRKYVEEHHLELAK